MKRRKGSRQSLSLQKCRRSGPCEVIAIGQMCACFTAALCLPGHYRGAGIHPAPGASAFLSEACFLRGNACPPFICSPVPRGVPGTEEVCRVRPAAPWSGRRASVSRAQVPEAAQPPRARLHTFGGGLGGTQFAGCYMQEKHRVFSLTPGKLLICNIFKNLTNSHFLWFHLT